MLEKFKALFTGKSKPKITHSMVAGDSANSSSSAFEDRHVILNTKPSDKPKEYIQVATMDTGKMQPPEEWPEPPKEIRCGNLVELLEDQVITHKGEDGKTMPKGAKGLVMQRGDGSDFIQVYFRDHKARIQLKKSMVEVVEGS